MRDVLAALQLVNKQFFNAHDFIEKYAEVAENDYVDMLAEHNQRPDGKPFRTVHAQLALYLQRHQQALGILELTGRKDENIFGNMTEASEWEDLRYPNRQAPIQGPQNQPQGSNN